MKKFKNYLSLAVLALLICFCLTACGNNAKGSTSGNNNSGNAAEDAVNDAANATDDLTDGIGNAVDDLVGKGGFDNYADAHSYFMDTMGSYHSDAKFEIRDEDKNLNDYQEGSKGYHFKLYDTSKNKDGEMFGEFYVDANSGTIYKKGDNGKISEYPGSGKSTNNGNSATKNNTNNSGKNISRK